MNKNAIPICLWAKLSWGEFTRLKWLVLKLWQQNVMDH